MLRKIIVNEHDRGNTAGIDCDPLPGSEDVSPVDVLADTVAAMARADSAESASGDAESEDSQKASCQQAESWVLSIDDDDDFAEAMQLKLKSYGLRVERAKTGMEGYLKAFLENPSAIILDYELPEGDGDYVLRRLKESPATWRIPVIVLTGRRGANVERQMRGLGADEFFNKPLDWDRLAAALGAS